MKQRGVLNFVVLIVFTLMSSAVQAGAITLEELVAGAKKRE